MRFVKDCPGHDWRYAIDAAKIQEELGWHSTYLTQSGRRRILRCHTCTTHFSETLATVFFDLRTSAEKIMMALKMLLVRVDLAGLDFVLGVTKATVLAWLRRVAHRDEAINHIGPLMLNDQSRAMIERLGVFWPSV